MFESIKKLILNVAPLTLLVVVLISSFRMVQSESGGTSSAIANPFDRLPIDRISVDQSSEASLSSQQTPPLTPVTPQAVVVEAKASATTRMAVSPTPEEAVIDETLIDESMIDRMANAPSPEPSQPTPELSKEPSKKQQVWDEINEVIIGLNGLVGDELFLALERVEKGQLQVRLDEGLWKRVRYQTRVDLKTDISNLWHLYVKEYDSADRSVVFFLDASDDQVIDIFSKAN